TVMHDFAELWPDKFCNITNGVTPRRFVAVSNPPLAQLITQRIGDGWLRDLDQLRKLEPLADDDTFRQEWRGVKTAANRALSALIEQRTGIKVSPDSLFDIQIKRLHEYKRQHLNVLHILTLYRRLQRDPKADVPPRTFIFGAKAAPGYVMAKLIIKLINSVAEVVNRDPAVRDRLKVVFFPDYNVKNAQHIFPAADVSEQISTAGKEASGTGNMKFAMNGALTIGTLDGANVEIREEAGADNFFLFGLTVDQIERLKRAGYRPSEYAAAHAGLRAALELVRDGAFSNGDRELFRPLLDNLMRHDEYMVCADYASYEECQARVDAAWRERERWTRMSIVNAARMGKFSSDRAIREYMREIWNVEPLRVPIDD